MAGYFANFPNITYNGKNIKNIMKRSTAFEKIVNLGVPLQTLELQELERPDYIAEVLFERPEFDYILYMVNDIVDPYYDWYLSQNQLEQYAANKYGTNINQAKHYEFYQLYRSKTNTNFVIDFDNYIALSSQDRQQYEKIDDSVMVISNDTYDLLDSDMKQFYFIVTNYEYEKRENDKRRFINIVSPANSTTVNRQIKQSLNNQPIQ